MVASLGDCGGVVMLAMGFANGNVVTDSGIDDAAIEFSPFLPNGWCIFVGACSKTLFATIGW